MTNRQIKLVKLLESLSDHRFTQKEICDNVEGYTYTVRNNDRCADILRDKNEINAEPSFKKIIVCKKYKFKIASREEYLEERAKHIRRLKNQVKIIKDMDYKNGLNWTLDLLDDLKVIETYGSKQK